MRLDDRDWWDKREPARGMLIAVIGSVLGWLVIFAAAAALFGGGDA